ncbi:DNA polymerase III subunit delta' [Lacticaseibacillus jixiensis]|uniref:DNA polymerase III subunit delta' n=1 Tax=Lacticaseibacillus jixiensis TaxID=3231926 RepID=UPI0036F33809
MLAIEQLQPSLVKQFTTIIQANQLSQAYVFNGAAGVGKVALAEWIAMRLFCLNVQAGRPCGECAECQRIISHNHPDVVELRTDARSLKVDDVRALKSELTKSGMEGQQRVFIIEEAEKMTPGAANSLLKFYEEPVAGATIILTTTAKNQLLPTILSRAQIINFLPPSRTQLEQQLTAKGVIPATAALVASLTADLTQAQALADDADFAARVAAVLKLAGQLANRDSMAFVSVQAELMPHAKSLPEQTQMLALLGLVYEDAMNRHYQVDQSQAFLGAPVVDQLAGFSAKALVTSLTAILQAQVQLRQNVTFQSDCEQLMLKLLAV